MECDNVSPLSVCDGRRMDEGKAATSRRTPYGLVEVCGLFMEELLGVGWWLFMEELLGVGW